MRETWDIYILTGRSHQTLKEGVKLLGEFSENLEAWNAGHRTEEGSRVVKAVAFMDLL